MKIHKALKKEGVFLLEGYNFGQLEYDSGGPKNKDLLFSKNELEKDFSTFTVTLLQDTVRNISEGEFHTGEASVVQLIAKK